MSNSETPDSNGEQSPLELHPRITTVPSEWIDYNGHMSEGYYGVALSLGTDEFMDHVGIHSTYRKQTGGTLYTAETHLVFIRELHEGDALRYSTQLIDFDEKRLHMLHTLYHGEEGYLAATGEYMLLYVDQNVGKVVPMPETIIQQIRPIAAAHKSLPYPEQAGRTIGIRRR